MTDTNPNTKAPTDGADTAVLDAARNAQARQRNAQALERVMRSTVETMVDAGISCALVLHNGDDVAMSMGMPAGQAEMDGVRANVLHRGTMQLAVRIGETIDNLPCLVRTAQKHCDDDGKSRLTVDRDGTPRPL